jgi:rare lipoprotein A
VPAGAGPLALAALLVLAGCSTPPAGRVDGARAPAGAGPQGAADARPAPVWPPPLTDGPPADPPPDLARQPDPEPTIEPLRTGGPNKPYELFGQRYVPLPGDVPFEQAGLASWYGRKFHGRRTANGELFDMYALTAAHPTLPLPSWALVRNPRNGREVVVRVNDRGPFGNDRIVDLSYAAAVKLGVERGVAPVQLRRITHDEIRTGRWREGGTAMAAAGGPAPAGAGSSPVGAQAAPPAIGPAAAEPVAPGRAPGATVAVASSDRRDATAPAPIPASAPAAAAEPPVTAITAIAPGAAAAAPAAGAVVEAPSAAAAAARSGGFWVQLGAFARHEGALDLRAQLARELAWLEHALTVRSDRRLYRVQAGPFPTRAEAHGIAERVRGALQTLQPLVVPPR